MRASPTCPWPQTPRSGVQTQPATQTTRPGVSIPTQTATTSQQVGTEVRFLLQLEVVGATTEDALAEAVAAWVAGVLQVDRAACRAEARRIGGTAGRGLLQQGSLWEVDTRVSLGSSSQARTATEVLLGASIDDLADHLSFAGIVTVPGSLVATVTTGPGLASEEQPTTVRRGSTDSPGRLIGILTGSVVAVFAASVVVRRWRHVTEERETSLALIEAARGEGLRLTLVKPSFDSLDLKAKVELMR